jgi:putative ABC transport system ATP-binding protein
VVKPEAVLCDEPTGNLDTRTSSEILRLLRSIPEPGKRSVVMVTHDAGAAHIGDRVVHIRDGLIEKEECVRKRRDLEPPHLEAAYAP